jgi:predicted DCC family thiol-disulfide oxidoreductase YuxK
MKLTLFFDGYCPLCAAEMKMLGELDLEGNLIFEDIHAADFAARYPSIDPVKADKYLHGLYEDESMIFGLDVTHQAWRTVGRKPWLALLRWPIIRWFSDIAYRIFAKNRYSISWLLTGQKRCTACTTKTSTKPEL